MHSNHNVKIANSLAEKQKASLLKEELHLSMSPKEKQELIELIDACVFNANSRLEAKLYNKARLHYKEALKLYKQIDAPFKDIYNCHEKLGICCLELAKQNPKQLIQAKIHFENAIKHYSAGLGSIAMKGVSLKEQHVHLAYSHDQLITIHLQLQEFEKAKQHALKAFDFTRQAYNDNINRNAICLENLAVCYKAMEDYTRAISFTEGALKLYRQLPDVNEELMQSKELALESLRKLNSVKPILAAPATSPSQSQKTSKSYAYGSSRLYSESKQHDTLTILSILHSTSPLMQSSHLVSNAQEKATSVTISIGPTMG